MGAYFLGERRLFPSDIFRAQTAMSLISRHFSALGSASRLRLAPSVATKSARCASSTTSNGLVEKEEEDDFRRPSSIREEGEEDDGLDDRGDITFQQWLKDVGKNYKEPLPGQTNWLSNDRVRLECDRGGNNGPNCNLTFRDVALPNESVV